VRVIRALYQSAETGAPVELAPFEKHERPSLEQEIRRPPVEKPEVIKTEVIKAEVVSTTLPPAGP